MENKANEREAYLIVTAGQKGCGKTFQNQHVIADYIKDKVSNRVRGSKVLIIDTNGEYTTEQFARNGVANFPIKKIAVKDVVKFANSTVAEARRIDTKNLSIKDKLEIMSYCLHSFRNGLILLEDINSTVLNVTHEQEIVGSIVTARHKGIDILISYQSLRPVEPRIWQNANFLRLHKCIDNVSDIKGKVPNPEILKIAQLLVDGKYNSGDKRFFLFVNQYENQIEGVFSHQDFDKSCMQYLNINKKIVKEYMSMHGVSQQEAIKANVDLFKKRYLS